MANPNLMSNTIAMYGKNAKLAITVTATAILTNAAESGKVMKVNLLQISNIDGVAAASITAVINDGSTDRHIAKLVVVPAKNAINLLDKYFYLLEGESIKLTASADGDLEGLVSYEEIG